MRVTPHGISTTNTVHGPVSTPVYEHIMSRDAIGHTSMLNEISILKLWLEDLVSKPKVIETFGETHIPEWIVRLLDEPAKQVMKSVPKTEHHHLRTTLVGVITEVKNGKYVWSFVSNPKKTGYAYSQDALPIKPGEYWLLLDSGKPKSYNQLIAGVRLTKEQAIEMSRALSAAWCMVQE